MSWLRRNWRIALVLFIGVAGLFVLVMLYILRKRAEANKLIEELAVLKAGAEVQGLVADKQAREAKLDLNAIERDKLDKEIAQAKRNTVAVVREVSNLSDADIADAFKRMGY